jgi:uncharacterized membrane protein
LSQADRVRKRSGCRREALVEEVAVSLRMRRERNGAWWFELEPNRSSSWPQTKRVLTAMGLLNGLIALVFAGQGLWLVAPFSGLEVAALGIGLYCCSRASYRRELIQLDGERLVVLRGGYRLESRDEFARPWVRLYWQPQANRGCGWARQDDFWRSARSCRTRTVAGWRPS